MPPRLLPYGFLGLKSDELQSKKQEPSQLQPADFEHANLKIFMASCQKNAVYSFLSSRAEGRKHSHAGADPTANLDELNASELIQLGEVVWPGLSSHSEAITEKLLNKVARYRPSDLATMKPLDEVWFTMPPQQSQPSEATHREEEVPALSAEHQTRAATRYSARINPPQSPAVPVFPLTNETSQLSARMAPPADANFTLQAYEQTLLRGRERRRLDDRTQASPTEEPPSSSTAHGDFSSPHTKQSRGNESKLQSTRGDATRPVTRSSDVHAGDSMNAAGTVDTTHSRPNHNLEMSSKTPSTPVSLPPAYLASPGTLLSSRPTVAPTQSGVTAPPTTATMLGAMPPYPSIAVSSSKSIKFSPDSRTGSPTAIDATGPITSTLMEHHFPDTQAASSRKLLPSTMSKDSGRVGIEPLEPEAQIYQHLAGLSEGQLEEARQFLTALSLQHAHPEGDQSRAASAQRQHSRLSVAVAAGERASTNQADSGKSSFMPQRPDSAMTWRHTPHAFASQPSSSQDHCAPHQQSVRKDNVAILSDLEPLIKPDRHRRSTCSTVPAVPASTTANNATSSLRVPTTMPQSQPTSRPNLPGLRARPQTSMSSRPDTQGTSASEGAALRMLERALNRLGEESEGEGV